jgi:hypothetical protein
VDDREHTVDQWKDLIYKEVMEYEAAHSTPTYAPNIRQVEKLFFIFKSLLFVTQKCCITFHRLPLMRMKLMATLSAIVILGQQPNGRSSVS